MTSSFRRETVKDEEVLRLAGLPAGSVEAILLRRGIRPESVAETRSVLQQTGTPFSAEEMVEDTFTAKFGYETPFPPGRYGNGHWPVYYAASTSATCADEIAYHLQNVDLSDRYYVLVSCQFDGYVWDLEGEQNAHPELVSPTNVGYSFCQQLAATARHEVSGLHTPSARHASGRCVPVFSKPSLSNPRQIYQGKFVKNASSSLEFQRV